MSGFLQLLPMVRVTSTMKGLSCVSRGHELSGTEGARGTPAGLLVATSSLFLQYPEPRNSPFLPLGGFPCCVPDPGLHEKLSAAAVRFRSCDLGISLDCGQAISLWSAVLVCHPGSEVGTATLSKE